MVDGLVDRATPVGEIIVEWGGLIAGWVSNPFHAAPTLERYLPFVWCVCLYGNMCVCVCVFTHCWWKCQLLLCHFRIC